MPVNGGPPDFNLPERVLAVLPSDPYEQLDVARKITSIALATRVSKLESEISKLGLKIREKEELVEELLAKVENLESSLTETSEKLVQAEEEKDNLLNQNASLSNTVKKLNRDVAKLEIFRKTLVQSLQEEEDGSQAGGIHVAAKSAPETISFSSQKFLGEEDASLPPSKLSSMQSQNSDTGSSFVENGSSIEVDALRHGVSHGHLLPSHSSTPRLTPPDSPTRSSAATSPKRLSKPVSPRRHSISVSATRNMFDDRSSVFSSMPSNHHSSTSSPFDSGRGRVDGKEFFRQVRSRLSYEQFSAFLANVKELNSHKQTREETLKKANEIFGPDNKDLYSIFEGLISRNHH